MATLVSPGIDVSIINESFYGSAGTGTVPLFVIATAQNKAAAGGNGIAPGTLASQAGKLFMATSQRDAILNFGNPLFHTLAGTPLHGHELNEYGLHGAYSFLGIANRAYMLRANIDMAALEAAASAPRGEAIPGTYWLDLVETKWGLFQSNGDALPGNAWVNRVVKVCTDSDIDGSNLPKSSFGSNGDFCVVTQTNSNHLYEKIGGSWFKLDNTTGTGTWRRQHPLAVKTAANPTVPSNGTTLTVTVNNVTATATFATPANLAAVVTQINNVSDFGTIGVAASVVSNMLVLTQQDSEDMVIGGTSATGLGISGTFQGNRVLFTNTAQYPTRKGAGSIWMKLSSPNNGAAYKLRYFNGTTAQWTNVTVPFYAFDATLQDTNTSKDAAARTAFPNPTTGFVYAGFSATQGVTQLRRWDGSKYVALSYEADAAAPTTLPEDGTLWYSAQLRADIMVNTDGTKWEGYRVRYPNADPVGVQIAGSAPTTQSDGTDLVDNDLWLDSSDLENYPRLYRWNTDRLRWVLIDSTDQTTPFGVIFADARADAGPASLYDSSHTIANSEDAKEVVLSNFLDPDAPDPRAYPDGMLMFNTRYSTYNVKVWRPNHFLEGGFDENTNYTLDTYEVGEVEFDSVANAGRWVTASGNRVDGSPYMGRKAQRIMVVRAMAEAIMSNDDIRSSAVNFNLIAAPGYPELIDEMISLNTDCAETAFIVGDTPARLMPNGTAVEMWAKNMRNVASTGEDGLTAGNPYVGLYYPWALSTNTDGNEIMVPPSTVALRTIAYNDQVAYPWFAPAGFQRGLVTNAASVGYLTSENEYRPVILNSGQQDALYLNKINPIVYFHGRGLVVNGQKTLEPLDSALDRVNVARLTNYMRFHLDNIVKPFLFEPNDQQTRDSARLTVERFLLGLVGLRALEDFAVLCDETNNTPERRDRNELWIDIIIKPVKAIEFIYIPVRLRNSGDSLEF